MYQLLKKNKNHI